MNKQDKLVKFMHSWQKEQDPNSSILVAGKKLLEFLDRNSPIKLHIGFNKKVSYLMNGRILWLKFISEGSYFYQLADWTGSSEAFKGTNPRNWDSNGNKYGVTPISNQITYGKNIATKIYNLVENNSYQKINTKEIFKDVSKLQKTNAFIKKNKTKMNKTSRNNLMTNKMNKCFQYMIDGENDIDTIKSRDFGLNNILLESMEKTNSNNKTIDFKAVTPVTTYNLLTNTVDNLAATSKY